MKKNLKVLYLLNTTIMGGGNLSFINMIRNLYDKGVEIFVASPDCKMDDSFYQNVRNIISDYYTIKFNFFIINKNGSRKENLTFKIKAFVKSVVLKTKLKGEVRDITKIVKKNSIDLIHTNVGIIRGGFLTAKRLKIPHVWHIREYQDLDFNWKILPSKKSFEKQLKQSYVITITKSLIEHFNLHTYSMAQCIYNGCFSKNDTCLVYPKDKYFLCCSRISREKKIDEAIIAFSLFRNRKPSNKDYKLLLAGFGNEHYIEELKQLISNLGMQDCVKLVGYQKDVRSLMDHATALIVPSKFEGFGRMTAESAFRGCVVIGRKTGGTKEIIDQIGGFLYSEGHTELSEKMSEVSELSRDEYIEISNRAQLFAKLLFSNEESSRKVFDLYQKIIRTSSSLENKNDG